MPKCEVLNKATREEICSVNVETEDTQLYASMFSQEMRKKCQTHYVTECQEPARPRYGR